MKNRILSALLCLLLVAATTLPVLTPILQPVEVSATSANDGFIFGHATPGLNCCTCAIFPASLIEKGQPGKGKPLNAGIYSGYWDGIIIKDRPDLGIWAGGSRCDYDATANCIKLTQIDPNVLARVRINLNDLFIQAHPGSSLKYADYTHVRIIARTAEAEYDAAGNPKTKNINGQLHIQNGGNTSFTFNLTHNANINISDVEISMSGLVDCMVLTFTGTFYLYAVQLFKNDHDYYKYYTNDVCITNGGIRVSYHCNGAAADYVSPAVWGNTSNGEDVSIVMDNPPSKPGYDASWVNKDGGQELKGGATYSWPLSLAGGALTTYHAYAKWTPIDYKISLQGNSGSVTPSTMSYTIETSATLPTPSRAGYSCTGWYCSTGSGLWSQGTTYAVNANVYRMYGAPTLTAQWKADSYNMIFDPKGGEYTTSVPSSYTIESGTTLPGVTRPGYLFLGWQPTSTTGGWDANVKYAAGTSANGKYNPIGFAAQWTPKTDNTITYDSNGATDNLPGSATYTTDATITLAGAPTKPGYTFKGWKVTENSGNWGTVNSTTYDASAEVSGKYGNVKLQAQWDIITYNITYDLNNGSMDGSTTASYTAESPAALGTPTRTGYTFAGWKPTTSSGGWSTDTLYGAGWETNNVYGSVTLVAQWTPIEYGVTLELGGGELSNGDSSFIPYTIESAVNLPVPTRHGHTFDGWKVTAIDAEGNWVQNDLYTVGDLSIAAGKYGNVTLTAQWTANTYNISYELAGGQMPAGEIPNTYTYGTELTLPVPTRPGYNFLGWKVDGADLGATGWDPDTLVTAVPNGATGSVSLTAQWQTKSVPITYHIPDGTGTLTDTQDYVNGATGLAEKGSAIKTLNEGYVFAGWYSDPDCTVPVDPTWVENGRLTVDVRDVDPANRPESYAFYAKIDYAFKQITLSAACTENPEQTFIYRITGTPALTNVFGEKIAFEVTLLAGETLQIIVPLGDYIVTEYTDWSWRYSEPVGEGETEDVEQDKEIISRYEETPNLHFTYQAPSNPMWLNGCSVAVGTGKENETTD